MLPDSTLPDIQFAQRRGAWIFLGVVWLVSLIALVSPLADTLLWKAVFLAVPVACSLFVLIANPQEGFAVWVIGLTLLISQTGFQLDIGPYRTSALEVMLVFVLLVMILMQRKLQLTSSSLTDIPGKRLFIAFALYALTMAVISFVLNTPLVNIVAQFKGFLLYPLIALILLVGINSVANLRLTMAILIIWYAMIAASGMLQFAQGSTTAQLEANPDLLRADAAYAAINVFGITLGAISILCVGIALKTESSRTRMLLIFAATWLFLGAMTSLSRTVGVAYIVALIAITISSRSRFVWFVTLAVSLPLLLGFLFPEIAIDRLLQLSDSSSVRRIFYLQSGLRAWLANIPFGHGWGVAYWLGNGNTLIRSASFPWYHNDYLNLAVQVGLVGLLLYLAFWFVVLRRGYRAIRTYASSETSGIMIGSFAALIFLLTAAFFEHVLWRPDIAGLVGWVLGILLASIALAKTAPS